MWYELSIILGTLDTMAYVASSPTGRTTAEVEAYVRSHHYILGRRYIVWIVAWTGATLKIVRGRWVLTGFAPD